MSPRFRPVIRVFVSSSFRDLKEERNALQREVFPRLEHYCLVRGFQFQAIDLRWGVPGEAKHDHRAMEICFEELRRAQDVSPRPNFLVLLGDRYGWQSLAETITETEFRELERAAGEVDGDAARNDQARGSATEALRAWYRRDDNAVPVEYQLRSRNDWPGLPEWTEEDEEQAWKKVEEALWAAINHAYPAEGLAGRFGQPIPGPDEPLPSIVKFQASATEQETWRGALAVPDASEHVVAWYRTIRNRDRYEHDPRADDFFDPDKALHVAAAEMRDELRRRLHRDGKEDIQPVEVDLQPSADGEKLEVTRDHLQPMCDEIEARLLEIVDEEIRAYWSPPGASSAAASPDQSGPSEARRLELEQQSHQRFGEERAPAQGFIGREEELTKISAYLLDASDRKPLVIYGPSGTGKTAILARAAQVAREQHGDRVFLRFLGTTPQSSNLHSLLVSLCRELLPAEEREKDLPVELRLLQDEFDRLLATATAEQPILLFLDAIDQLDEADGARQAYWLRTPLPEHVRAVVSCLRNDDTPDLPDKLNEAYRTFERRKLLESAIAVESLTAGEAMQAIDLWLAHPKSRQGKRILRAGQRGLVESSIQSNEACRRPLYLRVLAEEARKWPSWLEPEKIILGENTAELIGTMFTRLEAKEVHGSELVAAAMGYLVAARRGLSENEILEVLWADEDYRKHLEVQGRGTNHELPSGATRIPIALWSRLRHDLNPYLSERDAPGAVVFGIYHREVERVVRERYLREGAPSILRHSRLAEYFQNNELQPWWRPTDGTVKTRDGTLRTRIPNARRASELPWALQQAAEAADPNHEHHDIWDPLANLLCDMELVEAKCSTGLVFELQEDYKLLKQSLPEAQAELEEKRRRDADVARWTREFVAYSAAWSDRRDRRCRGEEITEPEPVLPVPPQTVRIWTDEEIEKECDRIRNSPTCLDRVSIFAEFIHRELYPLLEFGERDGFVLQHARNAASDGPVYLSACKLFHCSSFPMLTRNWPRTSFWNPQCSLVGILEVGKSPVYGIAVDSQSRLAISCGRMRLGLRVWDLETRRCVRALDTGSYGALAIRMTPDARIAVVGTASKFAQVWDLALGVPIISFIANDKEQGGITNLALTPDGTRIVTGAEFWGDCTLRVWDSPFASSSIVHDLKEDFILSLAMTPDGRYAITGGMRRLRVWDLENGGELRLVLAGPIELAPDLNAESGSLGDEPSETSENGEFLRIESLAVTPDGTRAITGSFNGIVRIWSLKNGKCEFELRGHSGGVTSISVTPDGQWAISGGRDYSLRLWNLKHGLCARTLTGHSRDVLTVAITPDANFAVSGGRDHTMRLWNLATGASDHRVDGHERQVVGGIQVTTEGGRAVTRCWDKTIRVWNIEQGECILAMNGHSGAVTSLSLLADGVRAISGSQDHTVRLWNIINGECLRICNGHSGGITAVVLIPGKSEAVSAGENYEPLFVWDIESGECLRKLAGHEKGAVQLSVSRDGRYLVSGDRDDSLLIWDLGKNLCLHKLSGHNNDGLTQGASVCIGPDSKIMVSACKDNFLRVWNLESGKCLHELVGHRSVIRTVGITPDGTRAISASYDCSLRVWDLVSGVCVHELTGHKDVVICFQIAPDGKTVFSGSGDQTVRVWDIHRGNCVATLVTPSPVHSIAIASPQLILGTRTGDVLFYNATEVLSPRMGPNLG